MASFRNSPEIGDSKESSELPMLLRPCEVAALLRTTTRAVYAKIARGQLPGIVRVGRRVLIRRPPGLEDSSRYWSAFMTLEHLRIVHREMVRIIDALAFCATFASSSLWLPSIVRALAISS